ncbi:MAG: ATPase [Polyangiaceae bacterium]
MTRDGEPGTAGADAKASASGPANFGATVQAKVGMRDFPMLIALVLISGVFWWLDPAFLSARNLSQLAIELSATAVLSLGMLLIILPGHIDLSVGSGLGLIGGLAAVLIVQHGFSPPLALLVSALVSVAIYAGMGAIIVKEKIPSFIITLGGLLIFKGVHWLVIKNSTIPVVTGGGQNLYSVLTTFYLPPVLGYALAAVVVALLGLTAWNDLKKRRARKLESDAEVSFLRWFLSAQLFFLFVVVLNQYRGVPLALLVLGATAFVIHVVTQHLRVGRYLYAIGGNEEAAHVSGVPTGKVVVLAFAIMGVIVAISGFLQTAFAGASTTTTGQLMELDAIAACVIGGTSLKGGRGTVVGVLFGALIMSFLLNGMTLLALSPEMKFIARGVVLALAVWMDVRLTRKTARA